MNDLIKQKVDLIADSIFNKVEKPIEEESYALYSGEFGNLLFLFYYSKYKKNEKYCFLTEDFAERLFNQFIYKKNSHTYCNGLSGILYLFEFFRENNFVDMNVDDSLLFIDNYLMKQMRYDIQHQYYDFMHGALGVGLYFLKKGTNSQCIDELVDFLYQTAEKDSSNNLFRWKSVIDLENNLVGYNLSLSHGISSIIIFLSRVIKCYNNNKRTEEMLSGAVNYVLSQQKDFLQFGSYFPNYIVTNSQEPISKSRLAWCYGDLGIGLALWQAGKAIDNLDWKKRGLEILLWSAQRLKDEDLFIRDSGICHGAAGLAMIFRRMYLETNQEEFLNSMKYRLNQTLQMANFTDGLAGYKTYESNMWKCDYSLLTGISGIGLVLLSYLDDDKQNWDEMFLLS